MSRKAIVAELKSQPFFHDFEQPDLDLFAVQSRRMEFAQNHFILRYQQPAEAFYVLLTGQVVLLNHVPGSSVRPIETLTAPNLLGWSWLLPPYRWHFDAKAQTPVTCYEINVEFLRKKMAVDHRLAALLYKKFMVIVVERLQASRLQGMDIYRAPEGEGL